MRVRPVVRGLPASGLLLLVACGAGVTEPATYVGGASAQLNGRAYNAKGGPTTWWFEYGTTATYGSETPRGTIEVVAESSQPVSETITGLAEGTTYHYRACALDDEGHGICGADATVTTHQGQDTVSGLAITAEAPEPIYVASGGAIDARSGSGGTAASGWVIASPGSYTFRFADQGPVTCVRAEGNAATVGFVAEYEQFGVPDIPRLVVVVDGGPGAGGDRYGVQTVSEPVTDCPDPATLINSTSPVIRGDVVVHDHGDA